MMKVSLVFETGEIENFSQVSEVEPVDGMLHIEIATGSSAHVNMHKLLYYRVDGYESDE